MANLRVTQHPLSITKNERTLREELDMLESNIAYLKEACVKQIMTINYKKKMKPCKLDIWNLVI